MKKPASICDLHIHSVHSDGKLTPAEIVARCVERGLCALSITDHDTVKGQMEAIEAGGANFIEVLSGIEFSAREGEMEVHILGYLFDPLDPGIESNLQWLRSMRRQRVEEILAKLKALGVDVSYSEIPGREKSDSIGRPHVARALMEMGIVASFQEAFNRFIGYGRKAYVPNMVLPMDRIVKLIVDAGGVAVWAHPGQNIRRTGLLEKLISHGIEGVEVWHPNHDGALEEEILETARQRGLVPTGGSDFHFAESMKVDIGGKGSPCDTVDRLKELSSNRTLS